MINVDIENFSNNIYEYIKRVIEFNDVIKINTENGKAVVLSEENYNGLITSSELPKASSINSEILKGASIPIKECTPEGEIE